MSCPYSNDKPNCTNYDRCETCLEYSEYLLSRYENRSKWISCEDDLPVFCLYVLVTDGNCVDVGYLDEEGLWDVEFSFLDPDDVICWMYFPEDPRELSSLP